jgi:hypothetical protein
MKQETIKNILKKGNVVLQKAEDFANTLDEWQRYLSQFEDDDLQNLLSENIEMMELQEKMENVAKRIDVLYMIANQIH